MTPLLFAASSRYANQLREVIGRFALKQPLAAGSWQVLPAAGRAG
jgi:hypothetical protein